MEAAHTHGLEPATFLAGPFGLVRSLTIRSCLLEGDEGLIAVVFVRIVEKIEVRVGRRLCLLINIVGV